MARGSHRSPGNSQEWRWEASGWHSPEGCPAALSWPVPLSGQAPRVMAGGPYCSREDGCRAGLLLQRGPCICGPCLSVLSLLPVALPPFASPLFPGWPCLGSHLSRGSLEPPRGPESEPPKPPTRSRASDPGPSCCPSLCPSLPPSGHQAVRPSQDWWVRPGQPEPSLPALPAPDVCRGQIRLWLTFRCALSPQGTIGV